MATYINGGLLVILVILAVRSNFGNKYRGEFCKIIVC